MISVFDLFKVGIGPSSSHTTGPMKAAACYRSTLQQAGSLASVARMRVTLFGSLAWTGKGHASEKAIVLGLGGYVPESIDPDDAEWRFSEIKETGRLLLSADWSIPLDIEHDIVFDRERILPGHSNALIFAAFDSEGRCLAEETWYSVGGGFVVRDGDRAPREPAVPWPYRNAAELLALSESNSLTIADLVLANEAALRSGNDVLDDIYRIAAVMLACIDRGMRAKGCLPGALRVQRRANALFEQLHGVSQTNEQMPHQAMEYVNVYAIAVN